jgi:hypothetical protein
MSRTATLRMLDTRSVQSQCSIVVSVSMLLALLSSFPFGVNTVAEWLVVVNLRTKREFPKTRKVLDRFRDLENEPIFKLLG